MSPEQTRWHAAHEGHTRDCCDCGDEYGCSHGGWCMECLEQYDETGVGTFEDTDWPCALVLAALGLPDRQAYWRKEDELWGQPRMTPEQTSSPPVTHDSGGEEAP